MIIINGKILPMSGKVIENGFIRIEDGKIAEIGDMSTLTKHQNNDVIDAKGKIVLPGFVDAHCHIGLFEDGLGFEGDDGNEDSDPITPQLKVIDAINPQDFCFEEALKSGVTTVVVSPGSANPIAGQLAALKTYGKCVDNMLISDNIGMKLAFGENPKLTYHSKSQAPVTRMAIAALIREMLAKAAEYKLLLEEYAVNDECDKPDYDAKCEMLIPLLEKKVKAHIHAHRADDIFTGIRIAKEFDLDYVIIHGTEGHLIVDELLENKVPIITGPLICSRMKPELKNSTIKNPGILSKNNIVTAISTDHPEVPIQYLLMTAGLAVANGMDYMEALRSITIVPAKICGIDARVGSLKVDKDADICIFNQDPFALGAKPEIVIVNGKVV